jgi:hypothetical protein
LGRLHVILMTPLHLNRTGSQPPSTSARRGAPNPSPPALAHPERGSMEPYGERAELDPQRAGPSNQPVYALYSAADIYARYFNAPYPPIAPHSNQQPKDSAYSFFQKSSFLTGGTVLHKGFYDLLAMIPTPMSPSRFWTSITPDPLAGPRYEDQPQRAPIPPVRYTPVPPTTQPHVRNLKPKRVTKDQISSPTGFVYVFRSCMLHGIQDKLTFLGHTVISSTRPTQSKRRFCCVDGALMG